MRLIGSVGTEYWGWRVSSARKAASQTSVMTCVQSPKPMQKSGCSSVCLLSQCQGSRDRRIPETHPSKSPSTSPRVCSHFQPHIHASRALSLTFSTKRPHLAGLQISHPRHLLVSQAGRPQVVATFWIRLGLLRYREGAARVSILLKDSGANPRSPLKPSEDRCRAELGS